MGQRKLFQLSKGSFEKVEEIGCGVTSKVLLVAPLPQQRELFHLLSTQSTNVRTNCQSLHPRTPQELNPDLQKFDLLIHQNQLMKSNFETFNDHSSFSIEHGRQIKQQPLSTREYYALKIIQINKANEGVGRERQYENELRILASLSHPGIIKILDNKIIERQDKKQLVILEELGEGGDLLKFVDYLEECELAEKEKEAIHRYYIAQIIQIVDYLQRKGVSHLDIKAQNFVLDQHYRLKLIDFGTAEFFAEELIQYQNLNFAAIAQRNSHTYIGTVWYISPEMVDRSRSRRASKKSNYSKADIWSIGVLIYFIVTSYYPFSGSNTFNILEVIQKKEPNLQIIDNQDLRLLVEKMLVKNPAQRIGIEEIKKSRYFAGIDFGNIFNTESPMLRLEEERTKQENEELLFKAVGLVKINDKTRRRGIALSRRTLVRRIIHKESILEKINSFSNIHIKKNASENTEFRSENKIQSSNTLNPPPTQQFLTIARIGLKIPPQYFKIVPSTCLQMTKGEICRLQWPQVLKKSEYKDYPKHIQIKFQKQELMEKFVDCFRSMKEEQKEEQENV